MSLYRYCISTIPLFSTIAVSAAAQTDCLVVEASVFPPKGGLLIWFHFSLPTYKGMLILRNSWFLRKSSLANASPISFSTTLSLFLSHFPHPVSVFISYKNTVLSNFCHVAYPCLNCTA